jgi:hypothetical protein
LARKVLVNQGIPAIFADTMDDAAAQAAQAAKRGGG